MGMIVAIGGGENGHTKSDGTITPYETAAIDEEIVNLSRVTRPNFLFLPHATKDIVSQQQYYEVMSNIFYNRFGCECRVLFSKDLENLEYCEKLLNWADIIYEGGGNTKYMLELWKKTGFDELLKKAYMDDKVLCGVSAGASCWFKKAVTKTENGFEVIDCLGLIDGMFIPHADEDNKKELCLNITHDNGEVGIQVSNCAAIEVMHDYYKVVFSKSSKPDFVPFVNKSYWDNGSYLDIVVDNTEQFENINSLSKKESSKLY